MIGCLLDQSNTFFFSICFLLSTVRKYKVTDLYFHYVPICILDNMNIHQYWCFHVYHWGNCNGQMCSVDKILKVTTWLFLAAYFYGCHLTQLYMIRITTGREISSGILSIKTNQMKGKIWRQKLCLVIPGFFSVSLSNIFSNIVVSAHSFLVLATSTKILQTIIPVLFPWIIKNDHVTTN